jgi:hypothetical protein
MFLAEIYDWSHVTFNTGKNTNKLNQLMDIDSKCTWIFIVGLLIFSIIFFKSILWIIFGFIGLMIGLVIIGQIFGSIGDIITQISWWIQRRIQRKKDALKIEKNKRISLVNLHGKKIQRKNHR